MSKKLNDRANLTQELYKENSSRQNQEFKNVLQENSSDVSRIITNHC